MPCFIAVTLAATLGHAAAPRRAFLNRDGFGQVLDADEPDRPSARSVVKSGAATAFLLMTPDEVMAAPCVPLGPAVAPLSPQAQGKP